IFLFIKIMMMEAVAMLDIKKIRNDRESVRKKTKRRGMDPVIIDEILELDQERRELIQQSETLKSRRNKVSEKIAVKKKNKEDADDAIQEMRRVGDEIKEIDNRLHEVKEAYDYCMHRILKLIHDDVPEGADDTHNLKIRREGSPWEISFEPKSHSDVLDSSGLADFERAAEVSGARFVYHTGDGASLERALMNIMLEVHNKNSYREM